MNGTAFQGLKVFSRLGVASGAAALISGKPQWTGTIVCIVVIVWLVALVFYGAIARKNDRG